MVRRADEPPEVVGEALRQGDNWGIAGLDTSREVNIEIETVEVNLVNQKGAILSIGRRGKSGSPDSIERATGQSGRSGKQADVNVASV